MTRRPWDSFLTERDRAVFAQSGYGARQGWGRKPCLLIVDVTLGFLGDRPRPILESNQEWPDSCGEEGWRAVARIKELLGTARQSDVLIVYTKGIEPSADAIGSGRWADKNLRWREPGRSHRALEIPADIAPRAAELVLQKPRPSAFFGTALLSLLVDHSVDSLIVCGTTTSGCVRATVVDAFSFNYRVAVVADATFDRGEVSHAINLFDMDLKYADVVNLDHTLTHLQSLASQQEMHDEPVARVVPQA